MDISNYIENNGELSRKTMSVIPSTADYLKMELSKKQKCTRGHNRVSCPFSNTLEKAACTQVKMFHTS